MDQEQTVVGINRPQDGSVAVVTEASTVYSLHEERLTRRKHHWGRLRELPTLCRSQMSALGSRWTWWSCASLQRRDR
jgi:carbamoyltransferase